MYLPVSSPHRSPSVVASQSARLSEEQSKCASFANRSKKERTFSDRPSRGCSSIETPSKRAAAEASTCPTADSLRPKSELSEETWSVGSEQGERRKGGREGGGQIYGLYVNFMIAQTFLQGSPCGARARCGGADFLSLIAVGKCLWLGHNMSVVLFL